MKRYLQIISLLLIITLLLSACGKGSANNTEPTTPTDDATQVKKEKTDYYLEAIEPSAYSNVEGLKLKPGSYISIIGRYSNDSYWKQVEAGAKAAVDEMNTALGYKGEDRIKLTFSAPDERDDMNEQINILDEELARYPIAICMSSVDATSCMVQFDLAAENGIPILTFDSGSNYQNIASHISTNNIEAAQEAAQRLAALSQNSGDILIVSPESTSLASQNREQAFVDTMKEQFPDINVAEIYHMDQLETVANQIAEEYNANLAPDQEELKPNSIKQEEIIQYYLKKYPNLKGIYTTGYEATKMVSNTIADLEYNELRIVGFDAEQKQLDLLSAEVIDALIIQNPYAIGYATVVAAARNELELGNEAFVNTGYILVTRDSMKNLAVQNMLYQ